MKQQEREKDKACVTGGSNQSLQSFAKKWILKTWVQGQDFV